MKSVTIIFTCFNRKEKTKSFIESVQDENLDIRFVVTDDGSTDGTRELLQKIKEDGEDIDIVHGDGNLYWCGGMRKATEYVLSNGIKSDYIVFANDDVEVFDKALYEMTVQSEKHDGSVVVGVTCNQDGDLTYGGIRYKKHSIDYIQVDVTSEDLSCDSFNCNLVLIPYHIFEQVGNFDEHFTHSMGDFDYGLRIKEAGYKIESTRRYVGICERNPMASTWVDKKLSRKERLRLKETPKGLPKKEWFYFLKRHFGSLTAIMKSITPYIRILLGK